jgi:pimeloyl-ACP methyl ester carboxylesterase
MTTAGNTVAVNGTTLYIQRRRGGRPVLLVHGAGEDSTMLASQAERLAECGYSVVTYDRRGTRRSGRDDWPGEGASQHADDAAALICELGWRAPIVVGVSSGAVIALELASRHPGAVGPVIAWEPPAVGIIPGGAEAAAAIMAPVEAHLAAHACDFVGAQALLLSMILGRPVSVEDPSFAATRVNAEPFVRDDPAITAAELDGAALADADVTIAAGSMPNEIVAAAVGVLEHWTSRTTIRVEAEHEVYLTDAAVLTGIVNDVSTGASVRPR